MNRSRIIDAIWKETEHKVFISKRQFVESLVGWELATKDVDGETVGAVMVKGPEFHFITFGLKKPITRTLIADCIQPILNKHGVVRTKTPKDDFRQHRLNLLIGFIVESTDEFFTYFRMEQFRLRGVKTCLS